ncbi:hypothetical protein E2C01_069149 [Portunus trituberculatus]|uniref:Uncharacterized protein n=1 Tax=Portunus trituberculatus TaxID=210409 RepID=A0A5B7I212_PORTR|nr:hypothetical protein [Portunus trituberculatus]
MFGVEEAGAPRGKGGAEGDREPRPVSLEEEVGLEGGEEGRGGGGGGGRGGGGGGGERMGEHLQAFVVSYITYKWRGGGIMREGGAVKSQFYDIMRYPVRVEGRAGGGHGGVSPPQSWPTWNSLFGMENF